MRSPLNLRNYPYDLGSICGSNFITLVSSLLHPHPVLLLLIFHNFGYPLRKFHRYHVRCYSPSLVHRTQRTRTNIVLILATIYKAQKPHFLNRIRRAYTQARQIHTWSHDAKGVTKFHCTFSILSSDCSREQNNIFSNNQTTKWLNWIFQRLSCVYFQYQKWVIRQR
jgi:hypothetical protein